MWLIIPKSFIYITPEMVFWRSFTLLVAKRITTAFAVVSLIPDHNWSYIFNLTTWSCYDKYYEQKSRCYCKQVRYILVKITYYSIILSKIDVIVSMVDITVSMVDINVRIIDITVSMVDNTVRLVTSRYEFIFSAVGPFVLFGNKPIAISGCHYEFLLWYIR